MLAGVLVVISGQDTFMQLLITGEPGATVRVAIDDAAPAATGTLDGAGTAVISLRPTLDPSVGGVLVHLAYVSGEHAGETRTFPVSWVVS